MAGQARRLISRVIVAILILFCSSCSRTKHVSPGTAPSLTSSIEDHTWWQLRYTVAWPAGQEPSWWVDGMLANEVIAAALQEAAREPPFWRFHRRAWRDPTGHRFSFLFYARESEALALKRITENSQTLKKLISRGIVEQTVFGRSGEPATSYVSSTSDNKWHPAIQAAWPAYIMGASKTWLRMIQHCQPSRFSSDGDLKIILESYQDASRCVRTLWKRDGRHAFLHHLSALMGYEPLDLMTDTQF